MPAVGNRQRGLAVAATCVLAAFLGTGSAWAQARSRARPAQASLRHVAWMPSFAAPGTPARLDKVGVLKIGRPSARNVLVFEPGTSASSTYIVPLAQWLVSRMPGWQVWSVERRQNLLEDQSVLTLAKRGRASASAVFDYYLGWLSDKRITHHIALIPDARVAYAKNWGLNVAMQDLRVVIRAARRLGGKVVLSGHSLGGALVTAYATWNFHGRPGADDLAGLVFDDGASFGSAVSGGAARTALAALREPSASPWGGVAGSASQWPEHSHPAVRSVLDHRRAQRRPAPQRACPGRGQCDPARVAEAARAPHLPSAVCLQHRRGDLAARPRRRLRHPRP